MAFNPEDERFLQDIELRKKGFDPEISRLVDELNLQQFGKPIVYMATPPSQLAQERVISSLEKMAGNTQPPVDNPFQSHNQELIGYILPVHTDQSRHLMIFKDGTILVVEPTHRAEESAILFNSYVSNFAPSEAPILCSRHSTLPQIIHNFSESNSSHGHTILYRNDKPADVEEIDAAREQAIQVATDLKEQRLRTKEETSRRLADSLRRLLFPPKPPPQPE